MFTVVKYLIDPNALMGGPERIDIESDCEEGQSGVHGEVPEVKGGTEEQVRAVLAVGSFSACVRFNTALPPQEG